ncbi:MAG TPA: asparagine synthase (glutamine-hydrolyzing) [Planctomycetota bacterium]
MCGISGCFDVSASTPLEELRASTAAMTETLAHRGPDGGSVWVDASSGIGIGHRRLAVLDLSPNAGQPMLCSCGDHVLSFNGEIYNHHELRQELQTAIPSRPWRSRSDTEVMLHAFCAWGVDNAVARLNGMFAFALWDRKARCLFLGRDRLGEKPLYYGWVGQTFLFASEVRAFRAFPSFPAEIQPGAIQLYLRYGRVPGDTAVYKDVYKLAPGTILRVDAGRPRVERESSYWSAEEVARRGMADPFKGSDDEATDRLDALLREATRARMEADVPLGVFLSGGIDSSTVAALMQAQSSRKVRTFTIGFNEAAYDEASMAKGVAAHLATDHTALTVTARHALDLIPDLPAIYDEPFSDSSQIPSCLLARMARRHVTVCLSGDGGDELFAGYNRHTWASTLWKLAESMPRGVRGTAALAIRAVPPAKWDQLARALLPLLPGRFRPNALGEKLHKAADLLQADSLEEAYDALLAVGTLSRDRRLSSAPISSTPAEQMMLWDTNGYLPDDILVKVDRATMAVGLEGRMPILDPRVFEFAWRLPLSLKIRNRSGKWILRRLLNRYVPPSLTDRPKAGFAVPLDAWLRGPLREWAETLLDESRLRRDGWLNPRHIRKEWRDHLSGRVNRQHSLWNVLVLVSWLEGQRRPPAVSQRTSGETLSGAIEGA